MTCHDREIMNRVATKIVEIDGGDLRSYTGNYDFYERMRESEAQLRLSVQASNIGLWDWNIPDNRLYLSPEWKRQLGYRDDEIANHYREWESRLHPDDLERALPKVRAYLANPGPSYEIEFRLQRAHQLIADSNVKIASVAHDSGYRHLGLFNVMFKKRFGMLPSEWRRQNLSRQNSAPSQNSFNE